MQMVHHRLSYLEWRNMRSDIKKLTWATIYVQKIMPKYIYPDINTNKHINLVILSMTWSWQNAKGYCSHKCSNLCKKVSLYTLATKLTIFAIDPLLFEFAPRPGNLLHNFYLVCFCLAKQITTGWRVESTSPLSLLPDSGITSNGMYFL